MKCVADGLIALLRWTTFMILCMVATAPFAQVAQIPGYPSSVTGYDAREVAMVPRFCLFTLGFRMANVPGSESQTETDRWYSQLGPAFVHLHHYCWGLMKTNRGSLLARDATTRKFYWSDANKEFDYVIERVPPEFILLPEILTKKGENLVRLGLGEIAVPEFEQAASLRPDYWPAYASLSDYFRTKGDIAKARTTLELGLAKAPDANALKRRLAELPDPTARK